MPRNAVNRSDLGASCGQRPTGWTEDEPTIGDVGCSSDGGRSLQPCRLPRPVQGGHLDVGLPPAVHVEAFERFVEASGPICQFRPAALCIERAWRQADADGDDRLSTAELRWIRVTLQDWVLWRDDLTRTESAAIALGLLLTDALGIETLHATLDQDGDGGISRAELLADVRLDQRPIGEILIDPTSIDHRAMARRLGLPPALVERLPDLFEPYR